MRDIRTGTKGRGVDRCSICIRGWDYRIAVEHESLDVVSPVKATHRILCMGRPNSPILVHRDQIACKRLVPRR